MINIALFGPPGAGKGTQSEALVKAYNLYYISTGDLLRNEIAHETRLGLEAKSIISSGGLVSDEVIVQIIEKTIKEHPEANGFLFDGFPRTYIQCYILEGLMIKLNTSLNCLVSLEIDEEEAVARLLKRGLTSGRSDDNEEVIRNRLREYHEKTLPVLQFYKDKGIYRTVKGDNPIKEVQKDIHTVIKDELLKHPINIVLFGYPGSGRGSQGKALAKHFELEFVATGPMLDAEIARGTPLGKRIQELYESGALVSDEIVVPLIEQKLEQSKNVRGYIYKGFPRTLVQSYILDGLLRKRSASITQVIDIELPMLELIKRLDARSHTDACMPYDTTTVKIVQRLQEHETKTVPVIEKYAQVHGVAKVDGSGTFEEVFARLKSVLEQSKFLRAAQV
ncbi:MAG: adenylate kinase [Holophagales bacterium]|jgi:adenylate kinase|nr:adenylate kinase [Holophagales bacterium]